MGLYKLFSYNVEVQYKSCLFSKAMFFSLFTTILTLILPFIVAHKSRGFWLRSQHFFEQPVTHFTYEYLFLAETDDPSTLIACGDGSNLHGKATKNEEDCMEIQVQEYDFNSDGKNDAFDLKLLLNIPQKRSITSVILILGLDVQLKTVCPLHMQSLAVINKEFVVPSSGYKYLGDLQFYQTSHLPCQHNIIHTKYNNSVFGYNKSHHGNVIDFMLDNYFMREVTTLTKALNQRSDHGHTGTMQFQITLRIPEIEVKYLPSLMQELKWAWPQYLSLVVIFYWIFNKVKRFVFNNRLLMAWEIMPWKKYQ